jgi:hypothetical protein
MSEVKIRYKIGSKVVSEEEFDKYRRDYGIKLKPSERLATPAISGDRPWRSNAVGCHSTEVGEMNDALRNYGVVGAEFDRTGALTATSDAGRGKALEFLGYADKDAGFVSHNKHNLNGIRELYPAPHHHG